VIYAFLIIIDKAKNGYTKVFFYNCNIESRGAVYECNPEKQQLYEGEGGTMMKKRWGMVISLFIVLCFALSGSVLAFQDIEHHPNQAKIQSLKDKGIVSGVNAKQYNPHKHMTFAEGIQLIVKGLDLNIDHIRFIKEPLASDYYKNVKDNAWYAQSFIMAQFNLELPADVQPNKLMTREEFAHYLFKGMMTKGEFVFIEIYMLIHDEDQIKPEYMNSIQKLLISNVVELDENDNFRPNMPITRGEAAVMLYNGLEFLKSMSTEPAMDQDVMIHVEKIDVHVNKVTVSWGEKPNPGYRITIDRIEFNEDSTASIVYTTHDPDPDQMYAQVITEPKAITYVAAEYKPVLKAAK
jgi:hypothetical protein